MFLYERMIGAGIYVIALAIFYWLLRHSASWRGRRSALAVYLLAISVMGFFYVPYETADVYRLIEYMQYYAAMSLDDFVEALRLSGIPASLIYYRIIGSMEMPGLLSGITAFIVFLNIFYVLFDYSKRQKINGKAMATVLVTIMSTGIYMQTIGNIRTMLAFSIIMRCFYDETVRNKKIYRNIFWYLIACLIHPAAIIAVSLRLVSYVIGSVKRRKTRALLAVFAALPAFSYMAISLGGVRFLENITEKVDDYMNVVSYSYIWDNVIAVLTILILVIGYIAYRQFSKVQPYPPLNRIVEFSWILTIFALLFSFEHATFVRFTQLNLLIMLPVLLYTIANLQSSKLGRGKQILYRLYGFAVIAIFLVSVSRGALSSLKFFIGA